MLVCVALSTEELDAEGITHQLWVGAFPLFQGGGVVEV
jgi:hypothetical protein